MGTEDLTRGFRSPDPLNLAIHGAGRLNMPSVGITSFRWAAICTSLGELDADIAGRSVPTDGGSPFVPGSRFGPRSIRENPMPRESA